MKRLRAKKALLSFLAMAGIATSSLQAGSTTLYNVSLVNGSWTFIGVSDFQNYGASSSSSSTGYWDGNVTLTDAAYGYDTSKNYTVDSLEIPTWDHSYTGLVNDSTSRKWYTPRECTSSSDCANLGNAIYGTVGLMVTGQRTGSSSHDARTSSTDHNGVTFAAINYTSKAKVYTAQMRTMYIKSSSASAPDIKVIYQADYEGDTFYVRSGDYGRSQ